MINFNGKYIRCDLGIRKVLSAIPLNNPPTVHSEYVVTICGGEIPVEFKASYATLQRIYCEPVPGVSLLGKGIIVCDRYGADFLNLTDVIESERQDREQFLTSEIFVVTSESYSRLMGNNVIDNLAPGELKSTQVRINKATDMYSTFMLGFLSNSVDL